MNSNWLDDKGLRKFPSFLWLFILCLGVCLAIPGSRLYGLASKPKAEQSIPAFLKLAPDLYRGGQPSEEGFNYLKSLGVKTIVNFRNEEWMIKWEKSKAEQYGMDYINIPWQIYQKSDPKVMERFFQVLEDKSKRPLFFHCQHGVDRTGVMTALYYIKYEGYSPQEAYQKATAIFPPRRLWLLFVKQKFRFYTEQIKEA
jgi:protein tyrosine phosphatase (PTP) superfamily phosphohydrolase (DUF442 family)